MRLRFALAGFVVATAFLAACSSGTSCVFDKGCPPFPAPTPTPGTYSLAGTETQAFTYYYGFPTVQPPVTITTAIAQTVSVGPTSLASPFPPGTATDVHVEESDVIDQLQQIDFTSDSYTATGSNNVLLYGHVENTPASVNGQASAIQLVYKSPQIIDKSPETAGATWTNNPAAQLTETYSDGHTQDRTIHDDGTYKEVGSAQQPHGQGYGPTALTELSSGAGSYTGPFFSFRSIKFNLAAPSAGHIAFTYKVNARPTRDYASVPQWFSSTPVFFKERDAIRAGITPPPACKVTGTANDVFQTISTLDTVIGYTEVRQRDTYTQNGSAVCIAFEDTLYNFYDWNADTTHLVYTSPNKKKISQVLTTEVLSPATVGNEGASARRSPHGLRSAAVIPMNAIAALQGRFNAKIEATKRAILTHSQTGGVR